MAGLAHHIGRHVHADHPPGWADLRPRDENVETAAAAQVQDHLAGLSAAMAVGFPQERPMLAPSGSVASSASLYPTLLATCSAAPEPQHEWNCIRIPIRSWRSCRSRRARPLGSAPSCLDCHRYSCNPFRSILQRRPCSVNHASSSRQRFDEPADFVPDPSIMIQSLLFALGLPSASRGGSSKPTWITFVLPGNSGHDSWAWSQTVTT